MPVEPEKQLSDEFVFQQSIQIHTGSVRALGTHPLGEVLMSGSIDKTNKLFSLNNKTGKYDFTKEVSYHDGFVLNICPL